MLPKRVREPRGVVLGVELLVVSVVAGLSVSVLSKAVVEALGDCERVEAEDMEAEALEADAVETEETEPEAAEDEEMERESTDGIEDDLSELVSSGVESVTTLMPIPSLLVAGMKSVVEPSLRRNDVRCGWYTEQQPFCWLSVSEE